ncbi:hypothetical protein AB0O28_22025 [Microbispora sp. NPDC088329]|uniref:hypothetical protein n=1 Tax=Microbispora sp. NPDC088329 TaxID=3154869 RepID=UPI00341A0B6F
MKRIALLAGALGALIAGGVLHLLGAGPAGDAVWAGGTVLALAPAAWWVASALRAAGSASTRSRCSPSPVRSPYGSSSPEC